MTDATVTWRGDVTDGSPGRASRRGAFYRSPVPRPAGSRRDVRAALGRRPPPARRRVAAVAGQRRRRSGAARCSSGARRGAGPVGRGRTPGRRASGRSTCTASAAPRRTGPTSPDCSPSASRAGRWTCPGSAAARRRGAPTPSAGTCRPSSTCWSGSPPSPGRPPGRPVHLLGNSLGGLVSLVVAARRPGPGGHADADLPGDAGLPGAEGVQPGAPAAAAARHAVRRRAAAGRGDARSSRCAAWSSMCFGDPSRIPRAAAGAGARGDARARRAGLGAPRAGPQHARAHDLLPPRGCGQRVADGPRRCGSRRSSCGGTATAWSTRRSPRGWPATVPGARLLLLPGVGHVAMLEAPEETARAVLGLVEDAAAGVTTRGVEPTRTPASAGAGTLTRGVTVRLW